MNAYTKITEYQIEINGVYWIVSSLIQAKDGSYRISIEESRKNGQEDTHMSVEFVTEDGQWVLDSETYDEDSFDYWENPDDVNKLLEFVNKNKHPELP